MRRYVFIDFDGVLNTERHHSELVSSGQKCSDQYGPLFDPVAVENLKRIVDETEAEIVIISSWKLEGVERMMELWKARRMPGVLAGYRWEMVGTIRNTSCLTRRKVVCS